MFMKTKLKLIVTTSLCFFALGISSGFTEVTDGRVLMQSPETNAAVVTDFVGMKNVNAKSYLRQIPLNEGLVIRQSRIENGKIIIPPSGLYYTTRTPKSGVLQGDKVLLLGKLYHFVDQATRLDVLADVQVKKGEAVLFGDDTKALKLTDLVFGANGYYAGNATFKILKQSGNYYGTPFPVGTSVTFKDITTGVLNEGTGRKTGSYLPGEKEQNFQVEYYGTSVATAGQTYLVADEISENGVKVKEFATGALNWIWLSEKDPIRALLGPKEEVEAGDYVVSVLEVTPNSAEVSIKNKKTGKEITQVLGPLTEELLTYMPVDEIGRQKLVMRPDTDDIHVQLDIYDEAGAFSDGKIRLAVYHDLIKMGNPEVFFGDDRFIFRPDT